MAEKEFDPNSTIIKKLTTKKSITWMSVLGGIGAVGGALVAVNAFTGLNLRPAWGFEVDDLQKKQARVEQLLEKSTEQLGQAVSGILDLNRAQLDLKIKQIEFDRREARRELTELQLQADKYKTSGEPIPSFITTGISDMKETIRSLDEEKADAQSRLIQLQ